jgi:hypothetical protein
MPPLACNADHCDEERQRKQKRLIRREVPNPFNKCHDPLIATKELAESYGQATVASSLVTDVPSATVTLASSYWTAMAIKTSQRLRGDA